MTILDPDGYEPGRFRDVANNVLAAIEDALNTDGLNAVERARFLSLRAHAMRELIFREAVPDTIPWEWNRLVTSTPRSDVGEHNMETRRKSNLEWRRMNQRDRDQLFLDALADGSRTTIDVWLKLNEGHDQMAHGSQRVRAYLKSMKDRGLIDCEMESGCGGPPRARWSAVATTARTEAQ
jgi:hypothetical protein